MTYVSRDSQPTTLGDRYLAFLAAVLMGYALFGKSFAYVGLPPLFIGEIAFLAGLLFLMRAGGLIAALMSAPILLLTLTILWVLLRTLPFAGVYGFDSLRDSVVITYGGFAFIVIALLLEDANRINTIIRYYGTFLNIYIPLIPFLFAASLYSDRIPHWSGYDIPVVLIAAGEAAANLVGAAVFSLVGFRKSPLHNVIAALAALGMIAVASRGAMLAFVIPTVFAALVLGKVRQLATVVAAGVALFTVAYAIEASVTDYKEARMTIDRSFSVRQIVVNATSIAGTGDEQTEGTKEWRLLWWRSIINQTVYGPKFWTGRGFGLNLADADGFSFRDTSGTRALRNPHNVHMTLLARAGVPGLALWWAFLASWLALIMHAMWTARRRGEAEWLGLFLFIGCYAMSCGINATFDTALEAPMQGIWFWCMIGFGIGSVMVYRVQPASAPPMNQGSEVISPTDL